MRKLLALPVAALIVVAFAASPALGHRATAKTFTVNLAGTSFNGHAGAKLTAHVGDSLRFVWKNGFHNVVSSKLPTNIKKVNSGSPSATHKPLLLKLGKKGAWNFYCVPHRALGMTLAVTVK